MASKASEVLFELPIRGEDAGKGKIVVTQPKAKVYLLSFENGPDNRLLSSFCNAFLLALDILEYRCPAGVLISTSSIAKFYSNGMDLDHAGFTRAYMPKVLYKLWHRLLTYPMPTVALMNGHAFAGGLMLGMMHDYRVMNPHKGYLCLNELELGAPLRPPMTAVFRMKLSGLTLRKLVLEAHRFKALEALKEGLVDHVGGLEETLAFVDEFQLVKKAQPGASGQSVYAQLKREMWRETADMLEDWAGEHVRDARVREQVEKEREISLKNVAAWERVRSKL